MDRPFILERMRIGKTNGILRRPLASAPRRSGPQQGGARWSAAWTGAAGGGRGGPPGYPGATASGRATGKTGGAGHFIRFHLQALYQDVVLAGDRLDVEMIRQCLEALDQKTQ